MLFGDLNTYVGVISVAFLFLVSAHVLKRIGIFYYLMPVPAGLIAVAGVSVLVPAFLGHLRPEDRGERGQPVDQPGRPAAALQPRAGGAGRRAGARGGGRADAQAGLRGGRGPAAGAGPAARAARLAAHHRGPGAGPTRPCWSGSRSCT
ncbi:MAG: hypothetical protein M0C28_41130 [Candidatus Moduliflexus flocculans]|nr:hypothetical protein [Candidatus Moduliflexus flocculans]